MNRIPVMDQSKLLGSCTMGCAGRPQRSYVPNSGFDSRDRGQSAPIPCPICAGEGEVQIYSATDGTQTEYTTKCPRCLGFGKVMQEDKGE